MCLEGRLTKKTGWRRSTVISRFGRLAQTHNPCNWSHTQVKRHSSWSCSGSGGHSKRRKPAGKGAKGSPPRREVISAPFGTQRCQNGVCPNLEKCCVVAKALSCCVQGPCETGETVDLSQHGICASLHKIGDVGQRELRFSLRVLHCHSLSPAPPSLLYIARRAFAGTQLRAIRKQGKSKTCKGHMSDPMPLTNVSNSISPNGSDVCGPMPMIYGEQTF